MNTKIAKWGLGWVAVLVMACPLVWGGEAAPGNEDRGAVSRDAGQTKVVRNRMAEKAMATILRDLDEMVVNERVGCYVECDTTDSGLYGFGFDEMWFMGTAGDQDDDMPYEYFRYYVRKWTATNALGKPYVRFDLHRGRMIMSVADKYGVYPLASGHAKWWEEMEALPMAMWDDQVLLENVVQFDIVCLGMDGEVWMEQSGDTCVFDSTQVHNCGEKLGSLANVSPATVEVRLQVTDSDAAMNGGVSIADGPDTGLEREGRELMLQNAETYSVTAKPITGPAQWKHPVSHYVD